MALCNGAAAAFTVVFVVVVAVIVFVVGSGGNGGFGRCTGDGMIVLVLAVICIDVCVAV